jgi:hypothetical protein
LVCGYFYAREQSGSVSLFPCNAPDSLYSISVNQIPTSYVLYNNYPNPFNSGTTIRFDSPVTEEVEVTVFNLLGQRVATVFHRQVFSGINTLYWNGTDELGRHVASGIYIARLKTPTTVLSKKMLYLK